MMADRAVIVRRQRVDLGNVSHRRNEGGADRTSRSDQIAVGKRFGNQLLRDDVHDGVSVLADGIQLLRQALLHRCRQRLPVHLMGLAVAHRPEVLFGIRNLRGTFVGIDRGNVFDHVRDFIGIRHDDFKGLGIAQIAEFRKHFLRRPQIQRCLRLVLEAVADLDDPAVNLVFRIQEMDIARGDDRLVELLPELDDPAVDIAQILLAGNSRDVVTNQIGIVAGRLYFQIIVKIDDRCDFRIAPVAEDCLIEFACRAGRSQKEPVPAFRKKALGDPRARLEIIQMRLRNQLVEIPPAHFRPGQDDGMVIRQIADTPHVHLSLAVQFPERTDVFFLHHVEELQIDQAHALGPRVGTHLIFTGNFQFLAQTRKTDLSDRRHQVPYDRWNVNIRLRAGIAEFFARLSHEAHFIIGIVSRQHAALAEFEELLQRFLRTGSLFQHFIGNAGLLLDGKRNRMSRIHQRLEFPGCFPVDDFLCPILNDIMRVRTLAGRDGRENDNRILHGFRAPADDNALGIVNQIGFHSVNDLHVGIRRDAVFSANRMIGFRKSLHDAVVGNGDGLLPPAVSLADDVGRR